MNAGGIAKLCDFGLTIDTAKEAPVSPVGTLEYMAPELLKLAPMKQWQLEHLRRFRGARYCAKVRALTYNFALELPPCQRGVKGSITTNK